MPDQWIENYRARVAREAEYAELEHDDDNESCAAVIDAYLRQRSERDNDRR